jgi:hypothetical protein
MPAKPKLYTPNETLAKADPDMAECYARRRHIWDERGVDSIERYRNGTVRLYRQRWICRQGCQTEGWEWVEVDGMGYRRRVGSFHYDWVPEYKQLSEVPTDVLATERYLRAAPPELFTLPAP